MSDTAMENTLPETLETLKNSVRYSLTNIRKLMIETEMLRLEQDGLTELADKLGNNWRIVLPDDNARTSDDEMYYKWSEQIMRYRAVAKGVNKIYELKQQRLSELIELAGKEILELPRPLPEDISKQFDEISEYAETLKSTR